MMFARDTPIVVAKVPRSTLICADMQDTLRRCRFSNVIAADWYSAPIAIGDIEIYVLPFYGEQPLRYDAPRDPALRNWGNTYVVRAPQYCSWFLIDSGADALGGMNDVAAYVRRRFDRIDFVLSNLRLFHVRTPMYINGGLNWLTLAPKHLRAFSGMGEHCITLGPRGVAEICEIVRPTYYLPYADEKPSIDHALFDRPTHDRRDDAAKNAIRIAEVVDAAEAQQWGLVDAVADAESLDDRVNDFVARALRMPETSTKLTKRLIDAAPTGSFEECLERFCEYQRDSVRSPEHLEAMRARRLERAARGPAVS